MKNLSKTILLSLSISALFFACDSGEAVNPDIEDNSDISQSSIKRIDRVGRPEITNFTVRSPPAKILYNAQDSFRPNEAIQAKMQGAIQLGISFWDDLDDEDNWNEEDTTRLAAILISDHLVIDMGKPCLGRNEYLSIERALFTKKGHESCGGRGLKDDVIDDYYSYFVGGFNTETRISDGASEPAGAISDKFPYLAIPAPDYTPPSR